SSPVIYGESLWIQSMSSRTTRENHHHQTTRLDSYHLQLSRIQPLDDINICSTSYDSGQQLVADTIAAALEAQAANMENTDNTNWNPEPRETPAARKCSYKEFISCQPFKFKRTECVVGLICWFERTESVSSRSNCTEDCKVKFATGTLTEEALSWWNSFAQPIGIEKSYKITWVEFKKLLIKNIEGIVTASKPQTLKEAINIAQRLMDQVKKHNYVQGTNDHKRKFDDRRNTTNDNNYHNNYNNDHHQQQNRRRETFRAYAATPTENHGSMEWCPRVDRMRSRLSLKGVRRCRVVCDIQGGGEVVWLALELKGGDGGACGLLDDVGVKVVMTHFVASSTLDSAKSYVMQGAFCTQRKVSCVPFVFSILFVLSQGGNMSPDSFLPSILLLVAIIAIVVVTIVVVVAVAGVPSVLKLSFMVIANETNSSFRTIEVERLETHKLLRWTLKRASDLLDSSRTGSLPSGRVDLSGDEDPTDKDGDIGMGDSTGVLVSLGGGISQESNIGDGDNTEDGGTIVGGRIVWGSQNIVRKVRGKSILNIGSIVVGRRHHSVNNPV
nr:reverse transcriptase domain-containing protein [Tanacetum cinerariifolium]